MRDLVKMVVVLTVICATSGLVLSYVNKATKPAREYQLLKYVKGPSIQAVLPPHDNDPIGDKVVLVIGKDDKGRPIKEEIFPAKKNGKVIAFAYESAATGYHGLIHLMVGVDSSGKLTGMSIMTHSETPGLGARIVEPAFTRQFKGLTGPLKLSSQGGKVDGVSGATHSSEGVVNAVNKALALFPTIRKEVK